MLKALKTKKAMILYAQNYKSNNPVDTEIEDKSLIYFKELITRHPHYDEWELSNPMRFKISKDGWGNKNFSLLTADKEWFQFSYRKCVANKSKSHNARTNVISACRVAVYDQIRNFRDNNEHICDVCELPTLKPDVDHHFEKITFQKILNNFVANKSYTDYKLIKDDRGHHLNELDKKEWQDYHREHAILRLLCKSCHKGKLTRVDFLSEAISRL